MKQLFLVFSIMVCCVANILAQSTITLQGKVTEAKSGDNAIYAYIRIIKNGIHFTTVATDFDGKFVANLPSGTYDIEVSYVGMLTQLIQNIVLLEGNSVNLDIKLEENSVEGCLFDYKIPLISFDNTSSGATYTSEQIGRSPR